MLLHTKNTNRRSRALSPFPMPTMSQQSFPLVLLFLLILAKQSEQRILSKKSEENMAAKEMIIDDENANVFFPPPSPLDQSAADEQEEEMPIAPSSSHRLANAEAKYVARQLAEAAGLEEFFRPRAQRWLLRTETLKEHPILSSSNDGPGGLQFAVKRVVSESELNSLLKNAWLGRK